MSELPNHTYYLCDVTRKPTQTTTDGVPAERGEKSNMKARCRVYLTSNVPQSCLDVLLKVADISMWESPDPVPRGELLNGVRGVNALLCTSSDQVDKDVINCAGSGLCVVATLSEDTLHIDVKECQRRGIKLVTLPKMSKDTVANLTMGLLRQTLEDQEQQKFDFIDLNSNTLQNESLLCDKTVGIIGYGHVGQAVAQRFLDLGVKDLLYNDPCDVKNTQSRAEFTNFERLVSKSDIICICCKALTQKSHLFQKDAFKKMKKDAILIDSYSNGHAINYSDLYNALREKQIFAAGLDVRDVNRTHPLKTNLSALHNCYFFPFKECNHVWDMRSAASESVARAVVSALQLGRNSEQEER